MRFFRALEGLALAFLTYAGAALLMAMMLLTCVDVFGRYLFNSPMPGSFELTEILLAAIIFIGLPIVSLRNEHVTVDLFAALTPHRVFVVQHFLASVLAAGCTAYLAWHLWLHAQSLLEAGQTTTQLQLRLAWFVYGMSLLTGIASVALLIAARRVPAPAETDELTSV